MPFHADKLILRDVTEDCSDPSGRPSLSSPNQHHSGTSPCPADWQMHKHIHAAGVQKSAARGGLGGLTGSKPVAQYELDVDGMVVHVQRKRMKNMYLRVKPNRAKTNETGAASSLIQVSAPKQVNDRSIIDFVRRRKSWIDKQKRALSPDAMDSRRRWERTFQWTTERREQARAHLEFQLPGLLDKWEPIIGRKPSYITLRAMTTRWGSCTPKTGRIRINLRLGMMDERFLEYVLVHELTHLWENGHGVPFQTRMDEYLSDWRIRRRDLNRLYP